jgi:hypothetical protein
MAMPTVFIHIFIHGTVLAGYFFLNPYAAWTDSYDENCSAFQSARAARATMTPSYAELIRPLGLDDLTELVHGSCTLIQNCAATYIIKSFHQVFRHEMGQHDAVHYYTFGWSGLLSERERMAQARVLYEHLIHVQNLMMLKYPQHIIAMRLYGHSHGGQLIAHLADIDAQLRRSNKFTLPVPLETAFLCATPLVPRSIQVLILSSLFRWVINVTSQSDHIQDMDIISTPGHFCTQRIEHLNVPLPSGTFGGSTYIDLEVTIENSSHAVNHSSFFSCTNYRLPGYLSDLRSIRKTIDLFRPLPILVWYPVMQHLIHDRLHQPGYHQAQANICRQANGIHITLNYRATDTSVSGQNITANSRRYRCPATISPRRRHFIKRASTAGWNHLKRLIRFLWFWSESADS